MVSNLYSTKNPDLDRLSKFNGSLDKRLLRKLSVNGSGIFISAKRFSGFARGSHLRRFKITVVRNFIECVWLSVFN